MQPCQLTENLESGCDINLSDWLLDNLDDFNTDEMNQICSICSDPCSRTFFKPRVHSFLPLDDNFDDKNCQLFDQVAGQLKISISRLVEVWEENLDYPPIQFYSEVVSIFGSYLGMSICTGGELIAFCYLIAKHYYKSFRQRRLEHDVQLNSFTRLFP